MGKNICKIFAMMILSIVIALPAMAKETYKRSGNGYSVTAEVDFNSPSFTSNESYIDSNGNQHEYSKYYGWIKYDNNGHTEGYNIIKVTRAGKGYKLTMASWQMPYAFTANATCSGNTLKLQGGGLEEWATKALTKAGTSSSTKKATTKKTAKRKK